ncbi:MAG: tripartite tricarboxylate transporter substrate binding protein [Proteobacteria bacterium]|nr:tripartite tricarboxylate transporter substrate binding protein [Pseudomonadota bacterium]
MRSLKTTLTSLGLALGLTAAAAAADAWPSKPITMVLPFPAGGAADVVARSLAEEMSHRLGQPVLIDNRAGASGIVGANLVAKAPADGYTLLFTSTLPIMTNQFMYSRLPYDPRKDFAYISQVATGNLVLAVNPSVPAKSVKEFVAWAAQNKGKVNYGSWSVGSYPHLAGAFMSKSKGLEMNHIAYKGEAPMLQDLIGGTIPMAIGTWGSMRAYIETGKLRALAVTGDRRLDALPDTPTFAQAGLTEAEYKPIGWLVLAAPAATPAPIVARLEREAMAAANSTAVKARLQLAGLEPIAGSAAQFRSEYDAAMPVLERVVRLAGARAE